MFSADVRDRDDEEIGSGLDPIDRRGTAPASLANLDATPNLHRPRRPERRPSVQGGPSRAIGGLARPALPPGATGPPDPQEAAARRDHVHTGSRRDASGLAIQEWRDVRETTRWQSMGKYGGVPDGNRTGVGDRNRPPMGSGGVGQMLAAAHK